MISQGEAWFDEAMLTGEPVPQQKGDGDAIHAGTVVQDGSVLFTASAVGSQTTLAKNYPYGAPGAEQQAGDRPAGG